MGLLFIVPLGERRLLLELPLLALLLSFNYFLVLLLFLASCPCEELSRKVKLRACVADVAD